MGRLALAAKITHVPSMITCEKPGPYFGRRDEAINGLREIKRRIEAEHVDTLVVLDTHWLVNTGYHINSFDHLAGVFSSNEFPHLVKEMPFDVTGNPDLALAITNAANENGVVTMAHDIEGLDLEYGTLVPLHYLDPEHKMKVVPVAAWCPWHEYTDSRLVGAAIRTAIEASENTVAVLASGSLSHRIHDNREAAAGIFTISDEFYRQVDLRVVELWRQGRWNEFLEMLPEYATSCHGEGLMHDTAMLFGVLGWDGYTGEAEIITDWFPSSGTGQMNAVLPLAA